MILLALTDYNTGYSLEEMARRLKKKTNGSVSPSTITTWLHEYKDHCTYARASARRDSRDIPRTRAFATRGKAQRDEEFHD
jgi:hypothetical protein